MTSVTFSEVRSNFKSYLDKVNNDHDQIHIIRQKGGNAVLVGEEEWENLQENLHIYQNENLVARIRLSKEQLKRGEGQIFESLSDFKASLL